MNAATAARTLQARMTVLRWPANLSPGVIKRLLETLGLLLLGWRAMRRFLHDHAGGPLLPPPARWWNWTDQSRYHRAALAWASGNLHASEHWYLPGYPLLGALFVHLTPSDPFLLPDLGCLLLSGWLTACLAHRLLDGMPLSRLLGGYAFYVADVRSPWGLAAWIEPWTSTPLTPLLLGLLLATLRFTERPRAHRAALCGVLWGLVVMVRPTEAMTAGLPAILVCGVVCFRLRSDRSRCLRVACAGAGAASLFCLMTLVLHVAVFGWAESEYMRQSFGTGFEFSMLPLKWAMLAVDPGPLRDAAGPGLAVRFWWVLPGLAGILAAFADTNRRRLTTHLLVGVAVLLHCAMYLCYRDLHPEGLWRWGNYHYFKWIEGVLAVYALLLLGLLARRATRDRALLAGLAVAIAACLRVAAVPLPPAQQTTRVSGPHDIVVPAGLRHPDQALLVSGIYDFEAVFTGPQKLRQAGRIWAYNGDFKAWPVPGGFAIGALRQLPRGEGRIRLDPRLFLGLGTQLQAVRLHLVLQWPTVLPEPQLDFSR